MIVMQEELVFKPSTVAEKLRRIRLAISFIIRQKKMMQHTQRERESLIWLKNGVVDWERILVFKRKSVP